MQMHGTHKLVNINMRAKGIHGANKFKKYLRLREVTGREGVDLRSVQGYSLVFTSIYRSTK